MGIVSKTFLEEINIKPSNHPCYNQLRSSSIVTEWFKAIENKKSVNSLNLTLQNFTHKNYFKNLLILQRASSNKVINMIKHARKSLLFHNSNIWFKKEGNPLFDVTEGSYDVAKVCELFRALFAKKTCASGWY